MRLLEPGEVAEQLAVSRSHVMGLIKAGQLAYVRVGRCYRVAQEDVDEFVLAARSPRRDPELLRVRPRVRM